VEQGVVYPIIWKKLKLGTAALFANYCS